MQHLLLGFCRLESPRSRCHKFSVWGSFLSWFINDKSSVFSHGGRDKGSLLEWMRDPYWNSFYEFTNLMLVLPPWSNHLPRTSPIDTIALGIRSSHVNFEWKHTFRSQQIIEGPSQRQVITPHGIRLPSLFHTQTPVIGRGKVVEHTFDPGLPLLVSVVQHNVPRKVLCTHVANMKIVPQKCSSTF